MANRTATLYIRITTSDGRKSYCTPVFQSKGRLKPQHAMVKGQPEHHPEGVYYLRFDDKLDDCRATQGFYTSNLAPSYRHYERQHFIATLNDWGWYGPERLRPVWYTGKSWS